MENLKLQIAKLLAVINVAVKNLPTAQGIKIYQTALSLLGQDASPSDLAPDELGCAETVSDIIIQAGFSMPVLISTKELYKYLQDNWLQVNSPLAGDVIISPTGLGGSNGITNGHTGIVGLNGAIMSNSSATGTLRQNYTLDTWKYRYQTKGGYPIYFFRKT